MNEITLQTLAGKNILTDEIVEHDMDEIKCNGRRIGFVGHGEGAGIRFLLPEDRIAAATRGEIIAKVSSLRAEQGKSPISETCSTLPSTAKLREAQGILNAESDEDDDE